MGGLFNLNGEIGRGHFNFNSEIGVAYLIWMGK